MAKKNITFRLDEEVIAKLNELRGEKSQNVFLTELITSTSTSTSNPSPESEVTLQLQLLVQAQSQLQAMLQVQSNVQVVEPEPVFTVKPFEAVYVPPYPNPLEDEYYVIKKTAEIGDPVIGSAEYELDGFNWYLSDGYRPHFDNTGKPIPFRMTSSTGELLDVTEDEVKEIENKTGLTVKFER